MTSRKILEITGKTGIEWIAGTMYHARVGEQHLNDPEMHEISRHFIGHTQRIRRHRCQAVEIRPRQGIEMLFGQEGSAVGILFLRAQGEVQRQYRLYDIGELAGPEDGRMRSEERRVGKE